MSATDTTELVRVYLRIRDALDALEEGYKQKRAEMQIAYDTVAASLLETCNELDADSIKTPAGTIMRRVKERFWSSDWDAMHKFILEHNAPFLLEQRVHTANMRQFLDENPDAQPAGLQVERKFTVQVRKPTNK